MDASRRDVLSSIVVGGSIGIAGCGTLTGDSATPETTPTGDDTPSPTEAQGRTTETATTTDCQAVTLDQTDASAFSARIEASPQPEYIEVDAAITRSADEDAPAQVTVALQNSHPDTLKFQFGYTPPLGGLSLSHIESDAIIELWPDETYNEEGLVDRNEDGESQIIPDERTQGCWKALDRPTGPDYFESETLAPCEVFESTFNILAHPDNSGCFPEGVYERTDTVTIRDTEEDFELALQIHRLP